jgi:hypothetical protein
LLDLDHDNFITTIKLKILFVPSMGLTTTMDGGSAVFAGAKNSPYGLTSFVKGLPGAIRSSRRLT